MQTNTVYCFHMERGFVGELGAWDVPMKEQIHLRLGWFLILRCV
ncbi:hypothetical protein [Chryseobacterium sp. R2ACT005]